MSIYISSLFENDNPTEKEIQARERIISNYIELIVISDCIEELRGVEENAYDMAGPEGIVADPRFKSAFSEKLKEFQTE